MLVFSSLFPSDVKIQLNESFDFIGLNNYETNFKNLLAEQKQKLENIQVRIDAEEDEAKKDVLYDEQALVEEQSLESVFKNDIQSLLIEHYGDDIIEVRLKDMYSKYGLDISEQKYVYIKGIVSRVSKVEYNIGGNFDFSRATKKEKNDYEETNKRQRGIKETILSATAGIEFYDLKTGELLYTNVFTWKSKIKSNIDEPLDSDKIINSYKEDIKKIFGKIIKDASNDYVPGISHAQIVQKHKKNTWAINNGTNEGFDIGKTVTVGKKNMSFSVVEASPKVALIKPKTNISNNDFLNKEVKLLGNKKSNSNQPKVLVNQVEFIDSYMFDDNLDYDKSTITQWFKDNLATYCDFYIVPSDPAKMYKFQQDVADYGSTSSDNLIDQLVKPNYIIFPKVVYAYTVDYFGEENIMGQSSIAKLNILIEMQLVDINTGIIIKTIRREASREQEQTENLVSVEMNELFPELIKDTIYKLCKKLKEEFNISQVEAELVKKKKSFRLDYIKGEPFKHGQILYIYRKIKEVSNIGWIEERKGRIKIEEIDGKTFAKPLYGNIKIKSGDVIRDYSLPDQLSDNLVALKTTYNDNKDGYLLDITSQTKTEEQAALSQDLIRSNYYYSLSKNSKLTPVVDKKIQPFLSTLKNSFSGAYYEAISDEETKSKDVKIKFFGNIKSVIVKKEKVHKTRFEIIYALRYRLFNSNDGDEPSHESTKGLNIGIGDPKDESKAKKERKKRTQGKKNKILPGMTDKEINKEFFDRNLELLKTTLKEVSKNL